HPAWHVIISVSYANRPRLRGAATLVSLVHTSPPMRWVVLASCLLAACSVNTPPRLAALGNQEVAVNQTVEILVSAVDPDGNTLHFSIRDKPEAATFETTTLGARFRWTPIASDVPPGADSQDYPITFIVDDDHGGRDTETVIITVTRSGSG